MSKTPQQHWEERRVKRVARRAADAARATAAAAARLARRDLLNVVDLERPLYTRHPEMFRKDDK